jgi:hypothetical protein
LRTGLVRAITPAVARTASSTRSASYSSVVVLRGGTVANLVRAARPHPFHQVRHRCSLARSLKQHAPTRRGATGRAAMHQDLLVLLITMAKSSQLDASCLVCARGRKRVMLMCSRVAPEWINRKCSTSHCVIHTHCLHAVAKSNQHCLTTHARMCTPNAPLFHVVVSSGQDIQGRRSVREWNHQGSGPRSQGSYAYRTDHRPNSVIRPCTGPQTHVSEGISQGSQHTCRVLVCQRPASCFCMHSKNTWNGCVLFYASSSLTLSSSRRDAWREGGGGGGWPA